MKKQKGASLILVVIIILLIIYNIYSYSRVVTIKLEMKEAIENVNTQLNLKEEELNTQYEELSTQIQEKEQQITDLLEEIENVEEFNKYYSQGLTEFNSAIFDSYNANYNYELSSWNYDQNYFLDAIGYCVSARTLYSSSNGKHQKAISYFEETDENAKEKYKELVSYYIKASDVAIDINWAMYEACEYYESANDFYYRGFYDMGTAELEKGNEKIKKHDSLIKTYNSYISKIEVLEEKI